MKNQLINYLLTGALIAGSLLPFGCEKRSLEGKMSLKNIKKKNLEGILLVGGILGYIGLIGCENKRADEGRPVANQVENRERKECIKAEYEVYKFLEGLVKEKVRNKTDGFYHDNKLKFEKHSDFFADFYFPYYGKGRWIEVKEDELLAGEFNQNEARAKKEILSDTLYASKKGLVVRENNICLHNHPYFTEFLKNKETGKWKKLYWKFIDITGEGYSGIFKEIDVEFETEEIEKLSKLIEKVKNQYE